MVTDSLQPDARPRAKVFLSYARADPNVDVVRAVHMALTGEYEVFCDIDLEPGVPWEAEIEAKLAETDYFVVFLSAEAAKSTMLTEEARCAVRRQKDTGKPRILPVPLAYDIGELRLELGSLVRPFQGIPWQTPEDTTDLLHDLQRVFTGEWVPPATEIAPALARYRISSARGKRIGEAFVPPPDVQQARGLLQSARLLWITGSPGSGKQFLASALACELDQPVFELRRTHTWRHILQHQSAHSVLVLPDALALERTGTGDYETDLPALKLLCETDNTIILTCSDEEYTARNNDLLNAGFTPATLPRYQLTSHTYPPSLRTAILRNLVWQSHAGGIVSLAQRGWIDELLKTKQSSLQDWTLGELESFVTRSLPTTTSPTDVVQLLDRHASIEDQVHAWFLGLDEAGRSLLLTLLLFPDAAAHELWARFRTIVSEFETLRLIPQMSIPTLGVCRARCAPYVTQTDDLEIVEADVASAIARELTISWREYVIELRPLLKRWALPPAGQDRAITRSGDDESAAVRQEVARLVGELMKARVEDVLGFLNDFATHDQSIVRRAAAEAILHAFGSDDGARNCRELLRAWEANRSPESAAVRRRRTAAGASWRIALLTSGSNYNFALAQLQRHTRDIPLVRADVAYGIGRIINRHTEDVLPMLNRLAADQDEIVRRKTGVALTELSRRNQAAAGAILGTWIDSDDTKRRWTAAYALLVTQHPSMGDRDQLHALMRLDPNAFAGALASAITPGDEALDTDKTEHATRNLLRLATHNESAMLFGAALGTAWAAHPDRGALLCERLARLEAKEVNDQLVNAYRERLLHASSVSQSQEVVLADVGAGGARQQVTTAAVRAIVSELTDDIELDPKIAEAWTQAPDLFERFLQWLRTDLGDPGRRAVVLMRRLILESLSGNAKVFVQCAASWLRTPTIREDANDAIRAIVNAPELWSHLATPLTIEYWNSRNDVWLILDTLDDRSGLVVRKVAFTRLLERVPSRFTAIAIEETQDFPQIKGQVLQALLAIAETQRSGIVAAVRQAVDTTNRRRILRLLSDFSASEAPLKDVARDLWLTRLWLSVLQFFSTAEA